MRVRRFVLIVTFVTTLVAGPGAHADLNYRAEITGAEELFGDTLIHHFGGLTFP